MKFIGIIPARYASTRFPGKPLADMLGKPMIQRVYEQVKKSLDTVYVATDDQRIYDVVLAFGGKVVMTDPNHQSGTDRCYEAYSKIQHEEHSTKNEVETVVINIQGDEPFIKDEQIEALKACFADANTHIATLVKAFSEAEGIAALMNPNSPKVVLNKNSEALLFSRSIIPYKRGVDCADWLKQDIYYKHIGLYAYKASVLKEITSLAPSTLEMIESLEQLRWLENGFRIKVGITTQETIGIDTPEDMGKAIAFMQKTINE